MMGNARYVAFSTCYDRVRTADPPSEAKRANVVEETAVGAGVEEGSSGRVDAVRHQAGREVGEVAVLK